MTSMTGRGRRLLLVPAVLALLLLAGCSSAPTDEVDAQLSQIAGVDSVHVETTRVKATLADDIAAADAQTAIVALRDQAVAALGADVELVVVLPAGERDFGDAQPWEVYSYARWSGGAVSGDGFAQQAAFVASLADWETLLATPAQIRQVGFEVSGVDAAVETPAPGETAAPAETAAPEDPAAAVQVVELRLGQSVPNENAEADLAALVAELNALWVASGGVAEGITID